MEDLGPGRELGGILYLLRKLGMGLEIGVDECESMRRVRREKVDQGDRR